MPGKHGGEHHSEDEHCESKAKHCAVPQLPTLFACNDQSAAILMVLFGWLFAIVIAVGFVWFLWNWTIAYGREDRKMTWWQTLGLIIIARILFARMPAQACLW